MLTDKEQQAALVDRQLAIAGLTVELENACTVMVLTTNTTHDKFRLISQIFGNYQVLIANGYKLLKISSRDSSDVLMIQPREIPNIIARMESGKTNESH